MFLATSCCSQCMFAGSLQSCWTSSACSRSPSPLDVWRREAVTMGMELGDGLLQEVWFLDSSENEGSTRKS